MRLLHMNCGAQMLRDFLTSTICLVFISLLRASSINLFMIPGCCGYLDSTSIAYCCTAAQSVHMRANEKIELIRELLRSSKASMRELLINFSFLAASAKGVSSVRTIICPDDSGRAAEGENPGQHIFKTSQDLHRIFWIHAFMDPTRV